jgi:5-methylthioadenosine/S-adenosylhomocysteine deaminase
MQSPEILIKGATVVTMDPALGILPEADIHVRDGRIEGIGKSLSAPDAEILDAAGLIAVPGFVDGHRHMWEGLLRNALPDADLLDYLKYVNGAFALAYRPQDVYLGELVTALGALDVGVTTVLDWSHVQSTPEHTSAAIAALRTAGIRAVFGFGPPGAKDQGHQWPHDVSRLRKEEFTAADDLLSLGLATFSPEHQPYEQALAHMRLAREADALITMHAGVNGRGTAGQIERLGRDGHLGPDVNLVHCNTLSDQEWQIIADTGTSVSITPSTELQMGQGIPPLRQARSVGVEPSIGVDVEVAVATDMWTQMRLLFSVQRSQVYEARYAGQPSGEPVTSAEMLRYATVSGAAACGLADSVGTLSVGKQADLVLLLRDTLHTVPINDVIGAVVHNMDARNVDTVLVAGRVVKRHGAMVGVDLAKLTDQLTEARDHVFTAAGLENSASKPL